MPAEDYSNRTMWGIHAGKTSDADSLFLRKNKVALGWFEMGDLSVLSADRDAFKAKLEEVYPDKKTGYYRVAAGQLFRFLYEAKVGDLIIYPSKTDRRVHVGEITGDYEHDEKVQVKSTEGSTGDPTVSQLIGKLDPSEYGLFLTLGTFTSQARNTARNKSNLRLIDGEELVNLVLSHYEQFDSKYKGMLPLKRVYVPEPLEED